MNKEKYASYDLHLHTYWSYDACASVEYYFRRAQELNLRAIAITEHFTMDSMPEIISVSKKYPNIRYIAGAEMTVSTSFGNCDMVCLGLPESSTPEMDGIFEMYRKWQRSTGEAYSEAMCKLGFEFSEADRLSLLKQYRSQAAIEKQGITHVQGSVVMKKYFLDAGCVSKAEEYPKWISKLHEHAEFPKYPEAAKVLPVIKRAGGLVAIAHPTRYFNKNDLQRMDALREELDLDGIECAHDDIPEELTPFYRKYCVKYGLFSTAGSDSHADPANNPCKIATRHEFARHRGDNDWLYEIFERLNIN